MIFYMNNFRWVVSFVHPTSNKLVDRTGKLTVATTDPANFHIYISLKLHGELLARVVRHELAHCVMISYNMIPDIHKMVKKQYWIYFEEWICNVIAEHDEEIRKIEYDILNN